MSDERITAKHLERSAIVYVRQSSPSQVEHNRESTLRQYALGERAQKLGWQPEQVQIIDDDLGRSGASTEGRVGFARITTEIALGKVGILLGLEASRLARNNTDWYKLLDLCSITDTLIADADGIYCPGEFNDRIVLGLKGQMSEAELHFLRARLDGGIRNKAARGELYRAIPAGYVRGEGAGEILMDPDEQVQAAIRTAFEYFDEFGSVRGVWRCFHQHKREFPVRRPRETIEWVTPSYQVIHQVLTNPVYAGAYVYGRRQQYTVVDETGAARKHIRKLPRSEWLVLIYDHHKSYIDWATYERIQVRIAANSRPQKHGANQGAVREGSALLQGLAICGDCSRRLQTHYNGRTASPGYHCRANGETIAERTQLCIYVGGVQIDNAVSEAVLEALQPAGVDAAMKAAEQLESKRKQVLAHWQMEVERAQYNAAKAERHYRAVDPENRLVARGLEAEWERCLRVIDDKQTELEQRQREHVHSPEPGERETFIAMGKDLHNLWHASTTTAKDKKELLRIVLQEVIIRAPRDESRIYLTLHWRTGHLTKIELDRPKKNQRMIRTDEDTVDLVRRIAQFHTDDVIAGILSRQGKTTAHGLRFTAQRVSNFRNYWKIPRFNPKTRNDDGTLVNIRQAAEILNVAPSTVHRWLNDGFIDGEQTTPGAPWRIHIEEAFRFRFMEKAPPGYVSMYEIMKHLGVSRQTVLQRVKRGELDAIHVRAGRKKALRIKIPTDNLSLFDQDI